MEKGLAGKRIVIGGSRKIEEISTIIEKQGGVPLVRSLQGTVFLADKEVEPELVKFVKEGADWVIFTTGVGIETLVNVAAKLGIEDRFLEVIRQAKVASRGYKSLAALRKLAINPVAVDEDGTTKGLMRSLENVDFSGKKIMIQLHGESAPLLTKYLEDQGATVQKILPYQHIAPDTETVCKLTEELLSNECDAVCFTTATQVRSLFDFAGEQGNISDIVQVFKEKVLAVAVGKVTAEALIEAGVERVLAPENERMGAMIIELSKYYNR
ncbi:uroporphyrinogen-III synthase [Neobacillus ginsengisoli]|uniref:Uroporphyrinogen-III synthase n=1 Tax=Neobacillus ginsengisoli TaxID=904295 RepID=A0ABT9Y0P6_9BACI|nr:uroporphyrinogen-III synthase [Neobacillus ginsengisoli]MDQ0201392.1 uroporphyrinogen-III synthase [Neobacillus ginsengisoli]